jgi:hypothetical protein
VEAAGVTIRDDRGDAADDFEVDCSLSAAATR